MGLKHGRISVGRGRQNLHPYSNRSKVYFPNPPLPQAGFTFTTLIEVAIYGVGILLLNAKSRYFVISDLR
jgi:hypothetical protein